MFALAAVTFLSKTKKLKFAFVLIPDKYRVVLVLVVSTVLDRRLLFFDMGEVDSRNANELNM